MHAYVSKQQARAHICKNKQIMTDEHSFLCTINRVIIVGWRLVSAHKRVL